MPTGDFELYRRTAHLKRFAQTPYGTFGRLLLPGDSHPTIYTVEDRWLDNAVGVSCIPAGDYECGPRPFYSGGYDAIEIEAVPGRTHILIHIGNTHVDTRGCVIVGFGLGWVNNAWAVTQSRKAFEYLMKWFNGDRFMLSVGPENYDYRGSR